jgi:signal peptidase I
MKITRWLKDVALLTSAIFLVALAIFTWHFNIGVAKIVSESMAPELRSGDMVVAIEVLREDVRVGDILILPHPQNQSLRLAHRVVSIEDDRKRIGNHSDQLRSTSTTNLSADKTPIESGSNESRRIVIETKGDANPVKDDWVLELTSKEVPRIEFVLPISRLPLSGSQHQLLGKGFMILAGFAFLMSIIQRRGRVHPGS